MKKRKISWAFILAVTIVFGILLIGMLSYLNWAWNTYGRDYTLSVASLFVATIVGLAVIYTLKLTRDSLQLTRATQRPFLTNSKFGLEISDSSAVVSIWICNTGIYPADNVSVEIELFTYASDDCNEQILLESKKTEPSIYFPKEENTLSVALLSREHIQSVKNEEVSIRITIDYHYNITGDEHKTVYTGKILRNKYYVTEYVLFKDSSNCYWT